ncbi:MAG: FAD-dependent oxidoreductase [Fimbriimonadia bacterium]|jgi:2-oxoacid:acceptor oxidoreductase delta subunit (pyruvate/2-ketoisovalerate family)
MKPKTLTKITFRSYRDMPDNCVSMGDMGWNRTGSWRYVRPIYTHRTPPCTQGCPSGTAIERWMGYVAKGEYEKALETIRMEHPSPAILGRVCFHPCESHCNRSKMEGSVGINMLERHIGDMTANAPPAPPHDVPAVEALRVAVVGSGPAGLGAAYHLRRLGHEVEVFERMPALGGMLRYGIPSYRLPKDVLDAELDRIGRMGIRFHTGVAPQVSDLFQQGFHRVFLAFGAQRSRRLGVPGDEHPSVLPGLRFLSDVAQGVRTEVPVKVYVVGGGNTAIDAARAALRLGADVTILYRRTRQEMPAFEEEIEAALAEGVRIEYLVAPSQVDDESGLAAMTCIRMELGEPGPDGRRKPEPVAGSEFRLPAGLVLSAIGEEAELDLAPELANERGSLATDEEMRTSDPRVWAGGDMTDSPRTVIDAIASGKRAAIAIDCEARGLSFREVLKRIRVPDCPGLSMETYLRVLREGIEAVEPVPEVAGYELLNTFYFDELARQRRPEQEPKDRTSGFMEVHPDISEEIAISEAMRCLHCGNCISCDNCFIYCPDAVITPMGDGSYLIDYDYCKGCGVCVHECPRAAMEMIPERAEV